MTQLPSLIDDSLNAPAPQARRRFTLDVPRAWKAKWRAWIDDPISGPTRRVNDQVFTSAQDLNSSLDYLLRLAVASLWGDQPRGLHFERGKAVLLRPGDLAIIHR